MISQLNQLLFMYAGPIALVLMLTLQILVWLGFEKKLTKKSAKTRLRLFFLVMNLVWFAAVYFVFRSPTAPTNTFWWPWVMRPAISWQMIILLWVFLCLVLAPLWWFVKLPLKLFKKNKSSGKMFSPERRSFISNASTALLGAMVVSSAYGIYRQNTKINIDRVILRIPGLHPALEGFKIAQLADMHLGLWASQKEIADAIELAAGEKPHLVALVGDLVDKNPQLAKLYYEPLKLFKDVPYGVWGVLGNHDHYTGPDIIADLLNGQGLTMLRDERVNIPGLPLSLIGLDDQGFHNSWLGGIKDKEVMEDPDTLNFDIVKGPAIPGGNFTILLNHRPESFGQAARQGCNLYLAGHTHGGQYQVPFFRELNVAQIAYKYSGGLYHKDGAWLNVTRGIAAVGVPYRFGAWPEVSMITLTRGL